MADRVDPSAYACDIDSSLERLMSLPCDESPYLDFKGVQGKGLLPIETYLRRECCAPATASRLRST